MKKILRAMFASKRLSADAAESPRRRQFARLGRNLAADWLAPGGTSLPAQVTLMHRVCESLCASHGFEPVVSGRLPKEPSIIVCNHMSYIDPIVVSSLVPCMPIAKAEVRSWPIVGALASGYGVTFVRRGDASSGAAALRRAATALRAGVNVLNFPEGTTSADAVYPFRRGIFGMARRFGYPVVPVRLLFEEPALAWVGEDTFVPHYLRTLTAGPYRVHVRFGAPLRPQDFSSAQQFADEARARISGNGHS